MKSLREIFLNNLHLSSNLRKNLLFLEFIQKNWKEIVGKEFCSQANPVLIKDKILWIEVSNSYVFQTLSGKTLTISEKIKKILPEELKDWIKEVRFKINPFFKDSSQNKLKIRFRSSNSQKLKSFLRLCEEIKDPELKKVFIKMFKSYAKLKNF